MTKRIVWLLVLLFALAIVPALAQNQPIPSVNSGSASAAIPNAAPKLTDAQHAEVRDLQAELQTVYIVEYRTRDEYTAAMKKYDDQAEEINKMLEAKIAELSKGVDPTKYVFNRGTLAFDPVKPKATDPPIVAPPTAK